MKLLDSIFPPFKKIFTPPVFPLDEEKTSVARVLYYSATIVFIVSIGIVLINLKQLSEAIPPTVLRLLGCIASIIFLRYGKDKLATVLFIASTWVSIALTIPLNGGVFAVGYSIVYFVLIVIAALLIGFRGGLIVAVASVLYGAWLTFIQVPSTPPVFEMYRDPQRMWIMQAMIFLIITVFIHFATSTIRDALSKARNELVVRLGAEKLLQESEQNYREIFNATHEAIFIHDPGNGKIINANESALRMYGYDTKEELLACNVGDLSANDTTFS